MQTIGSDPTKDFSNAELIQGLSYPLPHQYHTENLGPNYYVVEQDVQEVDPKLEKALIFRKLLDEIEEAVKSDPNVWLKSLDQKGKTLIAFKSQ